MRVVVTGSRNWTHADIIAQELERLEELAEEDITVLFHGCAPGADTLAAEWAASKGIPPVGIPALWDYYGKRAGPIRNRWLLEFGDPDAVIAFPMEDSRGTWDMVAGAKVYGLAPVIIADLL